MRAEGEIDAFGAGVNVDPETSVRFRTPPRTSSAPANIDGVTSWESQRHSPPRSGADTEAPPRRLSGGRSTPSTAAR